MTREALGQHLNKHGVPGATVSVILQAIDAAGLRLVPRDGGPPAAAIERIPARRMAIDGIRGAYLVIVPLPGECSQRLAWVEFEGKAAELTRMGPIALGPLPA